MNIEEIKKELGQTKVYKTTQSAFDFLKTQGFIHILSEEVDKGDYDKILDFFKKENKIYMMASEYWRYWEFVNLICLSDCEEIHD